MGGMGFPRQPEQQEAAESKVVAAMREDDAPETEDDDRGEETQGKNISTFPCRQPESRCGTNYSQLPWVPWEAWSSRLARRAWQEHRRKYKDAPWTDET